MRQSIDRCIALAVLVVLLAVAPSSLQAGSAQTGEESSVRVITYYNATSMCIGDPKTPLCAAETFLACLIRGGFDLCSRAIDDTPVALKRARTVHPDDVIKYRVRSIARVTRLHIPRGCEDPDDPCAAKPGDVAVALEIYDCDTTYPMCDLDQPEEYRVTYYTTRSIKQHGTSRWVIVDIYIPRQQYGSHD